MFIFENDILQMEVKLKNEGETFINEYKTFVRKIGDHTAREIIRNALSQVFTNGCACNDRGRGVNKILKLPLYIS